MAVTTSPTFYGSPIHDGFATIRSARSRVKYRSIVEQNQPITFKEPQRNSEYFTLERPKNEIFHNQPEIKYIGPDSGHTKEKPPRLCLTEPIYAKVEVPQSNQHLSSSHLNEHKEVHYDSIDIKPRRHEVKSSDFTGTLHLPSDDINGSVNLPNGDRQSYERHVSNQDGVEQHSIRTDTTGSTGDFRRSYSDRDNCSETSSYLTDNDRPISSYSDNSTIPSTDTDDVLRDLPNKSKFLSPQKYATLNNRRPKSIDLKAHNMNDNSFYASLQRQKMGYHSEPNTPLTSDNFSICEERNLLNEVHKIPVMPLQNRNGFRRSSSETNGFTKRLQYRHSFTADSRPLPVARRPHKCCECITGIPVDEADEMSSNTLPRKLGTLYESQDPKVGCQTILRTKPPIPWWEHAIRKSRYKSCPPMEQVCLTYYCQSNRNNTSLKNILN